MPDPLITPEELAAFALAPQSASDDGQSASNHSPSEVIKAHQYAAALAATASRKSVWRGVVTARAVPPGSDPG